MSLVADPPSLSHLRSFRGATGNRPCVEPQRRARSTIAQ